MVGNLIIRGIIVGIVAGLLAFGFAKFFGEPSVDAAISFEAAHAAPGEADAPEIFSRAVQSGIGLLSGLVIVGAGLGGLFSVLFAFANGRIGNLGPQPTSVLLAFFGLMSIYVIPALKYPPNPPSVGEPETIKYRTALYFLMLVISIAATAGAWVMRKRLVPSYGGWNASLMAALAYLVVICAFYAILPGINEVPDEFPAVTLWSFRMSSLGIQTVLWGAIGLLFGFVVERTLLAAPAPVRRNAVAGRA